MFIVKGKYTEAKIMIDDIDETCMSQIVEMINNIAFTNGVSIMPDCHAGKGSVVGFTIPVGDKIIPNVIGVDENCGMLSFNIGDVDFDKNELDIKIRANVPFGTNIFGVNDNQYKINEKICKQILDEFYEIEE